MPFAIGGGIAVGVYVPYRMSTKDVDIYVKPSDRQTMIGILSACDLKDYYEIHPYERHRIYRAYDGAGTIVDVMWGMPNRRAMVDDGWLTHGPEIDLYGVRVRVLPPEELIWAKLYVLQRDRSDWPDILNVLYSTTSSLDWDRLIDHVGDDAPLLDALIAVFRWICPGKAALIPLRIRKRLAGAHRKAVCGIARDELLDSRPWFLPRVEETEQAC